MASQEEIEQIKKEIFDQLRKSLSISLDTVETHQGNYIRVDLMGDGDVIDSDRVYLGRDGRVVF